LRIYSRALPQILLVRIKKLGVVGARVNVRMRTRREIFLWLQGRFGKLEDGA